MKTVLFSLPLILLAYFTTFMYTHRLAETPIKQLRAIAQGDLNEAYLLTSKKYQQKTSLASFVNFIAQNPQLKNNDGIVFEDKRQSHHHGYLKGVLKTSDANKATIEYQLIKEKSNWRIDNIQIV